MQTCFGLKSSEAVSQAFPSSSYVIRVSASKLNEELGVDMQPSFQTQSSLVPTRHDPPVPVVLLCFVRALVSGSFAW